MAQVLLSALGVLAGCAVVWFLFRSVHSDGGAADNAREQLDAAQDGQRATASAIDTVANAADASAKRADSIAGADERAATAVDSAQDINTECQQLIDDSSERIAESEEILQAIRARAQSDGGTTADSKDSMAASER